jgi:hypothetical protein
VRARDAPRNIRTVKPCDIRPAASQELTAKPSAPPASSSAAAKGAKAQQKAAPPPPAAAADDDSDDGGKKGGKKSRGKAGGAGKAKGEADAGGGRSRKEKDGRGGQGEADAPAVEGVIRGLSLSSKEFGIPPPPTRPPSPSRPSVLGLTRKCRYSLWLWLVRMVPLPHGPTAAW